ncbi:MULTISPECIES: hypothetical protein [Agrobacterium]|uniref:Uncharacterized protein n=1 Tax=Agrobacterium tumefaciens TaxID=358 RepID=A0AAF0H222_AGRTU|nr:MULTISPECIES: hypothetical protein [Agrobacterium]WGM61744.1 hypothetical protein CFBP5506_19185 [Agrobacterium tumefaciens]CVI64224.1 conserved hypothetical protein [Agrobacterium salinitolerans str. Hayward 0363]
MGEINLTEREIDAIKAVDEHELGRLIDQSVMEARTGNLSRLRLSDCGPYVVNKLYYFERALGRYRDAKSAKKIEETHSYAVRTGSELRRAVGQMKGRMETEERQRLYWHVDDNVYWPSHFTNDLSVTISYRWRKAVEDGWSFGNITFRHKAVLRPFYLQPQPKRKPSKAKQEEIRQNELSSTWQHLMRTALYTLRDYFESGGDGNQIPETFTAVPDQSGYLNNFSARFWRDVAEAR